MGLVGLYTLVTTSRRPHCKRPPCFQNMGDNKTRAGTGVSSFSGPLHIGQTVLINTGDNESSRSLEQELALVGLHIGHNWPLPVIEAHAQAWPCLSPKFKLAQIQIQIQIQYKYNMLR